MDEKKKYRRQRWHADFFRELAKYGNVTTAAAVAGISRAMVYKALSADPNFEAQFIDAIREFRDSLLLRLTALAMKDDTPRHIALSAIQVMLERADRMLEGKPGETVPSKNIPQPADPNVLVINVDAKTAEKLFPKPMFGLPPVNGTGYPSN
jgi:hypothetical protein